MSIHNLYGYTIPVIDSCINCLYVPINITIKSDIFSSKFNDVNSFDVITYSNYYNFEYYDSLNYYSKYVCLLVYSKLLKIINYLFY